VKFLKDFNKKEHSSILFFLLD